MDGNFSAEAITELRETVAGLRADVKAAFKRIDEQRELVDTVHSLALSVRDMAGEMKRVSLRQDVADKKQDTMCRDIEQLKAKPVDNWQTLVRSALTGIVGALVGAAMLLLIK